MGVSLYKEETTMEPKKSILKGKGQITIPKEIRKQLNLQENDQLEVTVEDGRIILQPVVTIAKDQAWYWTKDWQVAEREAEDDIKNNRVHSFKDVEDAISFLRDEE